MAALFQQLRHVLAAWDGVESADIPSSVKRRRKWNTGKHKSFFLISVNSTNGEDCVGGGCDAVREGHGAGVSGPASEECPLWLYETDDDGKDSNANVGGDQMGNCGVGHCDDDKRPGIVDVVDSGVSQRQITKLELARAALALFTSNSGIYRPILQKTLGFVFGFIDELLEEILEMSKGDQAPKNIFPVWSHTENEEVAAAHERMRMMEVRMAKLVEEAATQRDHLKNEITVSKAREAKLEGLLKHQILLSHARWLSENGVSLPSNSSKQDDALYVKRLIARAENEKAIDELQKELALVQQERDELGQQVQKLMELNGKYAHQCVELAARLSILTDQNIGMAFGCEKYKNEVLVERCRAEKCMRDLQVAYNAVVAAFVNRQHAVQTWWEDLYEKRLDNAEETFAKILKSSDTTFFALKDDAGKEKGNDDSMGNMEETNDTSEIDGKEGSITDGKTVTDKGVNMLHHLWISRAGCNVETPMHLRSISSVEHLRVNPLFVERVVYMLLFEWRKVAEQWPLDAFTCSYIQKLVEPDAEGFCSVPCTANGFALLNGKSLSIVYAIDTVSRSGCCGSLTYAFGLVSRRQVNKSLFYMLESDAAVLFSMCRFLDIRRSLHDRPSGFIPVVQFAHILVAMYPSYSLSRLQQLLNAAKNDGGNRVESPFLIYYTVILPERMFLDSESITVENAGALWDTCFIHLLYKFICDDVEDSLQTIEDCFYASSSLRGCDLVSESQLLFQVFNSMSDNDRRAWFSAICALLASSDELKGSRNSVVVDDAPCISPHAAVKYLRGVLLLRRGTRVASPEAHINFLSALQHQWDKCVGSGEIMSLDNYFCLIKSVDEKRDAVWVTVSGLDNSFREVNLSDVVTVDTMLKILLENGGVNT